MPLMSSSIAAGVAARSAASEVFRSLDLHHFDLREQQLQAIEFAAYLMDFR
jgi:hypothetical protein